MLLYKEASELSILNPSQKLTIFRHHVENLLTTDTDLTKSKDGFKQC